MTINQRPRIHYWLLVCSCYLLPLYSQSTPLPEAQNGRGGRQQASKVNCAHDSIAELIKTSPVILKALGARIFTDADLVTETELWWSGRNDFLTTATNPPSTTTQAGSVGDVMSVAANGILITLTPKTIYKGASLLKMAPTAKSALRISESAYQYEGQLNATLAPLSCFDGNVLKMLPTELIAFGKLVTVQQQKQHQQQDQTQQESQQQQQQRSDQQHGADILRISINGLHRWTPQFENHIWKHLGWDDWSDFTLCSVTCGKGVQQRFRRCLLDNPMMNLNLNMNMNLNVVDDEVNGELSDSDDDPEDNVAAEDEIVSADKRLGGNAKSSVVSNNHVNDESNEKQSTSSAASSAESRKETAELQSRSREVLSTATTVVANDILHQRRHLRKQWSSYSKDSQDFKTQIDSITNKDVFADDGAVMRIFEGTLNDEEEVSEAAAATTEAAGGAKESADDIANKRKQRRKKKSAKSFSTLFCEGYNIEQRNCNAFECNDNINDLLKFYKKFPLPEELSTTSISFTQPLTNELNTLSSMAATTTETSSSSSAATTAAGAAGATLVVIPSSTLSNMGYVRSWHNNTNFTIMITLRVKNDTKTTARIFSIRNSTHNLYLEPSTEGLRLYLERDKTTEMLPVKFNLYDNRWHQVAISIQNGDFISIFVDCSWSNSFVVSKRLFSLPLDADVEIGRGFNGELQQLLVLPDNQERHQCSNVRTSINEVKRYIIDTFIDDYSN